MEVWRQMKRLVVSIRSPKAVINDLSYSNKGQKEFNVLIYCIVTVPIKKE